MAGFFTQLRLLMWKNLLLYIRRPCTLVFEIGLPILFACIMLAIRILIERDTVDTNTYYKSVDLHMSTIYPSDMVIGFSPDYTSTQAVMTDVKNEFNSYSGTSVTTMGFTSEAALETYYKSNSDRLRLAMVFVGLSNSALPTSVEYRIRPATNDSQDWRSTKTYPFY